MKPYLLHQRRQASDFDFMGRQWVKQAASPESSSGLSGMLYASKSGWVLLSVPNDLVQGVFAALDEPGVELPPSKGGRLNAHISVMRPEEIETIGGIDKISERGKRFRYTIKRFCSVEPAGWNEMSRCWMLQVESPELKKLRKSYGLSALPNNDKYDFHITCAVRRRKVLQTGTVTKSFPVKVPE